MEKIKITSKEVWTFQTTTWRTFTSQNGVYLEVNLIGHWKVRSDNEEDIFYDAMAFTLASEKYIQVLKKRIPEYKIAVEFV